MRFGGYFFHQLERAPRSRQPWAALTEIAHFSLKLGRCSSTSLAGQGVGWDRMGWDGTCPQGPWLCRAPLPKQKCSPSRWMWVLKIIQAGAGSISWSPERWDENSASCLIWFIPLLPLCSTASRTCLFPLSRYFLDHKSQKNDPRKEKQTTQTANTNRNQAANEPSSAEVAATPQKIGKKVALPKLQDLNKMLSLHRDFFFLFF